MLPPQAAVDGIGSSPDGLGLGEIGPNVLREPITRYHQQDIAGRELDFIEPGDTSPQAAVQSAGFTALLAALGLAVGFGVGGAAGMGAGLLLVGAVANGYRAQKWMNSDDAGRRHEAVVSATFAVGELLIGGYLGYRAYQGRKAGKKAA